MSRLQIDDCEFACDDQGRGPALLFVHGFPLDRTMWRPAIEELRDEHRVIAPDLRGFGESALGVQAASIGRYAADLDAILNALEVRDGIVLCGLSMGGYIAFEFWRRFSHRLRGVVLCDTRAQADTPQAAAARRETAARLENEGAGFLAESMPPRLLSPRTVATRGDVTADVRAMILRSPAKGLAAASLAMADRADSMRLLPEIDVPALVVVGGDDTISTPVEMRALAARLPQARCVEIANAGHLAPFEQPAAFALALREFHATIPR